MMTIAITPKMQLRSCRFSENENLNALFWFLHEEVDKNNDR